MSAACTGGSKAAPPLAGLPTAGPGGSQPASYATVDPGAPTAAQMNALLPNAAGTPLPPVDMPTPADAPDDAVSNVARKPLNLNFGPLPVPFPHGAVQAIAVSPLDGSIYVARATPPTGYSPDGAIYHLVGNVWKSVPGVASSLAVGFDGVLYAVRKSGASSGQLHAYVDATGPRSVCFPSRPGSAQWMTLNGQPQAASQVITSMSGPGDFPVVLTSGGQNGNLYEWGFAQAANCRWIPLPGAGIQIARNAAAAGVVVPTPPPGGTTPQYQWLPGGYFLVHSSGKLFKYNFEPPAGYVELPPNANATALPKLAAVAVNGDSTVTNIYGLYQGQVPGQVYQYGYGANTGYWFPTGSQATNTAIVQGDVCSAATLQCTTASPVYAITSFTSGGAAGQIGSATPAPPPTTVPFVVTISASAASSLSGGNGMDPNNTFVTIIGQPATNVASPEPSATWLQVSDANGHLDKWANDGTVADAAANLPFCNGTCTKDAQGNYTSQPFALPWLVSARIYISYNPAGKPALAITQSSGPAPWNGTDGSQTVFFDYIEYTWKPEGEPGKPNSGPHDPAIYVDTTQVNGLGLPIQLQLSSGSGSMQQTGVSKDGAFAALKSLLNNAPTNNNFWSTLTTQWPYRILSPDGPVYLGPPTNPVPHSGGVGLPGAAPMALPTGGGILGANLKTAWDFYMSQPLTIVQPGGELVNDNAVGQVDANENFVFHRNTIDGDVVAIIPSPFNTAYQAGNTWGTATQTILEQYGPFVLPTSIPVSPVVPLPQNSPYANAAQTIGNKVSTAINRGVFGPIPAGQPGYPGYTTITCNPTPAFFPATGAGFYNVYAADVAQIFSPMMFGYGQSYSIPFNDQCGTSTTISSPVPGQLTAIIHQF